MTGWESGPTRRSLICLAAMAPLAAHSAQRKVLIAHRGASAYAPENTLPAYRLAIEQGADYVEQDLQVTRDGVLVCLHDLSLERTTDAELVYPERGRDVGGEGKGVRSWPVADFTLEEIRRLDAGAWFGEKFRGTRIPTWQEAIEAIRGKAGLYPELKAPEWYAKQGLSMEKLVWETLRRNGLEKPGADPRTPVILQSFSAEALRNLRALGCKLPMTFLLGRGAGSRWLTAEGLREVRTFATGIGPEKSLVLKDPGLVRRAHELGLTVTAYTFRSADTGQFADVHSEMAHFLYELGVDAVFTDNPDQFPRRP
ncbi:MAG: glycerophosphodiester phosphodiesterase family protein [Bryobacterales bacterium]|nr:glycerophosphodiester phosphodiesterase family protein [Bryobacterales bacterium]